MWITNGMQSDWICLLANTSDDAKRKNKSLIVVPKGAGLCVNQSRPAVGGTQLPQYYLHDPRVRNCSALVGFSDRAMMSGLVEHTKTLAAQVEGNGDAERREVTDAFARGLTPKMPPRERPSLHRSIDSVVGRCPLKEVSATLIGVMPYITTGVLQDYAASRLIAGTHRTVGFEKTGRSSLKLARRCREGAARRTGGRTSASTRRSARCSRPAETPDGSVARTAPR